MNKQLIFEAEPFEAYSEFDEHEEEQPDVYSEFDEGGHSIPNSTVRKIYFWVRLSVAHHAPYPRLEKRLAKQQVRSRVPLVEWLEESAKLLQQRLGSLRCPRLRK
jgi:hypothetical protein